MTELTTKTIAELRDGFRGGDFSAREIATSFNAAVEAGRMLNAWTVETPELALAAADVAFAQHVALPDEDEGRLAVHVLDAFLEDLAVALRRLLDVDVDAADGVGHALEVDKLGHLDLLKEAAAGVLAETRDVANGKGKRPLDRHFSRIAAVEPFHALDLRKGDKVAVL